jgi:hypothetical protein
MSGPTHVFDPCAAAAEQLDAMPNIPAPALVSVERVEAAGVLMLAHLYGTRLRFFDAVDRARQLLDTDALCVDDRDQDLRRRLYCWPERGDRVGPTDRAQLVARVLGIAHPDVPDDQRDPTIQRLLADVLDAENDVCIPRPHGVEVPPAADQYLHSRVLAVRSRLSASMSGLTTMRVRDLQLQLTAAKRILDDVAGLLPVPCRPGVAARDLWGSLTVLVGDQLRADGIEIVEEAEIAWAWRVIFEWLAGFGRVAPPDKVCRAAALVRPTSRGCASCYGRS